MSIKFMFCSLLTLINWLQNHLLPCPFKWATGIDCPGCGFQRSIIALMEGRLRESLYLYPAAIPFIVCCLFCMASQQWQIDTKNHLVKKTLFIVTGNIMLIAYVVKMAGMRH